MPQVTLHQELQNLQGLWEEEKKYYMHPTFPDIFDIIIFLLLPLVIWMCNPIKIHARPDPNMMHSAIPLLNPLLVPPLPVTIHLYGTPYCYPH